MYSNDQHQPSHQLESSYQRLQVSDQPTQQQEPANHQRIPSESSILDEPIDVPTIEETNDDDFSANFDDRTYANYPSNHDRYADQSLSMSMDNEEPPLASSSRVQENRYYILIGATDRVCPKSGF